MCVLHRRCGRRGTANNSSGGHLWGRGPLAAACQPAAAVSVLVSAADQSSSAHADWSRLCGEMHKILLCIHTTTFQACITTPTSIIHVSTSTTCVLYHSRHGMHVASSGCPCEHHKTVVSTAKSFVSAAERCCALCAVRGAVYAGGRRGGRDPCADVDCLPQLQALPRFRHREVRRPPTKAGRDQWQMSATQA